MKKKSGPSDATDDGAAEPKSYVPYGLYEAQLGSTEGSAWSTAGDAWTWHAGSLVSSAGDDQVAWLGEKDPLSLKWDDYRCALTLAFNLTGSAGQVRSLVTYAQATSSAFDELNGYECAVVW
jgi:hypothetical protein